MNLADFLHANIYSGNIKVTLIVITWVCLYGCKRLDPGTLKSAFSQE